MSLDVEGLKADAANARKKLDSEKLQELQQIMEELIEEDDVKALRWAAYCYYAQCLLEEQEKEDLEWAGRKWK